MAVTIAGPKSVRYDVQAKSRMTAEQIVTPASQTPDATRADRNHSCMSVDPLRRPRETKRIGSRASARSRFNRPIERVLARRAFQDDVDELTILGDATRDGPLDLLRVAHDVARHLAGAGDQFDIAVLYGRAEGLSNRATIRPLASLSREGNERHEGEHYIAHGREG